MLVLAAFQRYVDGHEQDFKFCDQQLDVQSVILESIQHPSVIHNLAVIGAANDSHLLQVLINFVLSRYSTFIVRNMLVRFKNIL